MNPLHATVRRRSRFAALAAAVVLLASPAAATSPLHATCEIRFEGTSTLHDWEGSAPTVRTDVRPAAATKRWDADVVVPVAGLDTDNDSRDERMREVLDASHYPEIRAELRDIDPEAIEKTGRLDLALTIRNVTHPVVAKVHDWKRGADTLTFDAEVLIHFSQFSLEPPVVLGMIRVGDDVTVRAHVVIPVGGDAQ